MGTKPKTQVKEKALNIQDIENIIRLCSQVGVAELTFGDLRIVFGLKPKEELPPENPTSKTADVAISEQALQNISKEELENEALRLKEERLAFMHIENPWEAEKLLEDGELLDEFDDSDDGHDGESASISG